jgi:16S rRNA G966 N2-methylase RsmD
MLKCLKNNFEKTTFFDTFPEFYKTSKTSPFANRLNSRYLALIDNNKEIIENASILDLGSHDGRWSFAALKNGAKNILGIEVRKNLIENAKKNMELYNVSQEKYSFIFGDVLKEIKKIRPNQFDLIFCFGFFYHIMNHMDLLSEIKRINPKYLVLDTSVVPSEEPIVKIIEEDSTNESMGIDQNMPNEKMVLVGMPSKKTVEIMLKKLGFQITYFDWHKTEKNWDNLWDYKENKRISLVAENLLKINN